MRFKCQNGFTATHEIKFRDSMNLSEKIKGKFSHEIDLQESKDSIHVNAFQGKRLR